MNKTEQYQAYYRNVQADGVEPLSFDKWLNTKTEYSLTPEQVTTLRLALIGRQLTCRTTAQTLQAFETSSDLVKSYERDIVMINELLSIFS